MRDGLGGCIFVGTKDTLICDCGGFNSRLLSGRVPQVTPYLRRIPNATGYFDGFHEQDWIRACKESPENRVEGTSNFAYSTIQRDGVIRRIGDPSARLEQEIDVGRPKHAFHQHILFRRIEDRNQR